MSVSFSTTRRLVMGHRRPTSVFRCDRFFGSGCDSTGVKQVLFFRLSSSITLLFLRIELLNDASESAICCFKTFTNCHRAVVALWLCNIQVGWCHNLRVGLRRKVVTRPEPAALITSAASAWGSTLSMPRHQNGSWRCSYHLALCFHLSG